MNIFGGKHVKSRTAFMLSSNHQNSHRERERERDRDKSKEEQSSEQQTILEDEDVEECFFGKHFLSKDGEKKGKHFQKKEIVGLYFSAYWSPPCRNFTPYLAETYKHINTVQSDDKLEIIYISRDRKPSQFDNYFAQMPWLAIPLEDPRVDIFFKQFKVKGLPTLVVLGTNGEKITLDGRNDVMLYDETVFSRWVEIKNKEEKVEHKQVKEKHEL